MFFKLPAGLVFHISIVWTGSILRSLVLLGDTLQAARTVAGPHSESPASDGTGRGRSGVIRGSDWVYKMLVSIYRAVSQNLKPQTLVG